MSYIGSKPADAVLETNDIADGVVTNPKLSTGSQQNFRNIIINGDMSIAQRGTSQTSAGSSSGSYQTIDRFKFSNNSLGAFTQSQSTDVPTGQGFANSMKFDCTTADASPATSDYLIVSQRIEGQNLQYLKKGTANAESLTVSFWVKSAKTGTYIAELFDNDNTRQISKSYTINSANTWEKKTITYPGDTTGTLDNDNAGSLDLFFWLASGSNFSSGTLSTTWTASTTANRVVGQVNLADSTSNEWYITGVQLEAGQTASEFEFLPVDINLQRCRRYLEKSSNMNSALIATSQGIVSIRDGTASAVNRYYNIQYSVEKRATPTLTSYDLLGATGKVRRDATNGATAITFSTGSTCFNIYTPSGVSHYGISFGWYADAEL
jgi:hypothetical protein